MALRITEKLVSSLKLPKSSQKPIFALPCINYSCTTNKRAFFCAWPSSLTPFLTVMPFCFLTSHVELRLWRTLWSRLSPPQTLLLFAEDLSTVVTVLEICYWTELPIVSALNLVSYSLRLYNRTQNVCSIDFLRLSLLLS